MNKNKYFIFIIIAFIAFYYPYKYIEKNNPTPRYVKYTLDGLNGSGVINILNENDNLDYKVSQSNNLSNGDVVTVFALDKKGKEVKDYKIIVNGLTNINIVETALSITPISNLTLTNFNNNKYSDSVILYIKQDEAKKTINFTKDETVNSYVEDGKWESTNHFVYTYNMSENKLLTTVNSMHSYENFYLLDNNISIRSIHISIESESENKIRVEHLTLNGQSLNKVLSSDNQVKWLITGDLMDKYNNITVEGDVIIENKKYNSNDKIVISFGY